MKRGNTHQGFTLLEILVVVVLLGILSSIAIVTFGDPGREAKNAAFVTSLRQFYRAIQIVRVANGGEYPPDRTPSQLPAGAEKYIRASDWAAITPIGGRWDWDYLQFGVTAGISVYRPDSTVEEMREIDSMLDDGNLSTGRFRARTAGYIYIMEE